MKRKSYLLSLAGLLFVLLVQAYQGTIFSDKLSVLPYESQTSNTIHKEKQSDENLCSDPTLVKITSVTDTQATVTWDAQGMSEWEYHLQEAGLGFPPSVGAPKTKTTSLTLTQDNQGNPLVESTAYEYFIRVVCPDLSTSTWQGPFVFTTPCAPVSFPFKETFDTTSTTFDCWTIIDDGSTQWKRQSFPIHQGDRAMYFSSYMPSDVHDNWLITPRFTVNPSKIYELTFYYRTDTYFGGFFEILLSNSGTDKADFTTVISPQTTYKTDTFVKAVYYITGQTGTINLAWHIKNKGSSTLFLDTIGLDEVDCISPDLNTIKVGNTSSNSANFTWVDDVNTEWEYVVKTADGKLPSGVGTSTVVKDINVTTLDTGAKLNANTAYEFYVRSKCNGTNTSKWIGPIAFRTACEVQTTPFFEGFNTDSTSFFCWTVINGRNSTASSNVWRMTTTHHEGDQSIYYEGYESSKKHDVWLITPALKVTKGKYYRLTYYYKTSPHYVSGFEIKLFSKGTKPSDFDTLLVTKQKLTNDIFTKDTFIIEGMDADIHVGWHVNGEDSGQYLFLDAVSIEEVDCPEPNHIQAEKITQTSFELSWQDAFNTDWEYIVQKAGDPTPKGTGTPTKNTTNTVTQDNKGNKLVQNTAYVFYIRSKCSSGQFSEWMGPIKVHTACEVVGLPFWEGFNSNSSFINCWEIRNEKANQTVATWATTNNKTYEGTHGMYLTYSDSSNTIEANDWLISPSFQLDASKIYRLKYHYAADIAQSNTTFQVMASTKGKDSASFTKELQNKKLQNTGGYLEDKILISNYGGTIHFAFHLTGTGTKTVYIDNVFLEEVTTCPEPLNLKVTNLKSSQADLSWTDDFKAKSWEYVVQEENKGVPTTKGNNVTSKTVTVHQDHLGNNLISNTHYEFYVRTVCADGAFSTWAGPFPFTTTCAVFTLPFWEGFNSNETSIRCWSVLENNPNSIGKWKMTTTEFYEGDQAMEFNISDWMNAVNSDSWFVTPNIAITTGTYVLKFKYKASIYYSTKMEVAASSKGIQAADFTQIILPEETYTNGEWNEQIVYFNASTGIINLAFKIQGPGSHEFYLDDISIKAADTCPEPYAVQTTNQTQTTIDLTWQQDAGVTSWEVLVVDYKESETATPIQTVTVTGNPTTTITGLAEGKAYTFYVRGKCGTGNTTSAWSTGGAGGTLVKGNDDCTGAIPVPINSTLTCEQTVSGTLLGATLAATPLANCNGEATYETDVWFEFTATKQAHLIKLLDLMSLSAIDPPKIVAGLYDQPCNALVNARHCTVLSTENSKWRIANLIPGQKYYIRLGSETGAKADYLFRLCISTPEFSAMEVAPSGTKYSLEELVKEVFVKSTCDLVSNIRSQVGDGSVNTTAINAVGYFNKAASIFPFQEGIVLSTAQVEFVPGPFDKYNQADNPYRWTGDKDLNDAINDAGGNSQADNSMRSTQLEFDFIPVKDSIQFEYLFASNSYSHECVYACNSKNGALFAAWLIDTTTGEGQNLAKIPESTVSIALANIWDYKKIPFSTCSINPEYFWKSYYAADAEALEAPFNFVGSTVAMQSAMVHVVPGRKYHIKLAVIDFCPVLSHTSAVFFNAGSFDIGHLDLGKDLTIANENALCSEQTHIIQSGLSDDKDVVAITWYKDGIEITGEHSPNLSVTEPGTYSLTGFYKVTNCEVKGELVVEYYPAIHSLLNTPQDLAICRFVTEATPIDLTSVGEALFTTSIADPSRYTLMYYTDSQQKEWIETPTQFSSDNNRVKQQIFIHLEDSRTGCTDQVSFYLLPTAGAIPTKPSDVVVCESYILPALATNQSYYSQPAGQGRLYKAGDILEPGQYQLYIHQNNGGNCFEEVPFTIEVTPAIQLFTQEDVTMECAFFELPALPELHRYFIQVEGKLTPVPSGYIIYQDNTRVHIVAESKNKQCKEETSFVVRYTDCPIPKGFSPNGDGINDTFDLSNHGVSDLKIFNRNGVEVYSFKGAYTNQWEGQSKGGKTLPSGTYYYVITAFGKTRTGWVQLNR